MKIAGTLALLVGVLFSNVFFYQHAGATLVVASVLEILIGLFFTLSASPELKMSVVGGLISVFWTISTYRNNFTRKPLYLLGALATIVFLTIIFSHVIAFFVNFKLQPRENSKGIIISTIFAFVCTFAVWVSYWLALFPAIMLNDSMNQWEQANGVRVYTQWHPLIHTFLLKFFSWLYYSPATLVFFQIVLAALALAYALNCLARRGMPTIVVYIVAVVYAIYPMNGFFMSSVLKDIPYSILLLLLFVSVADIIDSDGTKVNTVRGIIAFFLLLTVTALMRKNGLYIVYILLVYLVAMYRNKRFVMLAVATLVSINGFNFYANHVLKADTSPVTEALSIPMQQISATYANGGHISSADRKYFAEILPSYQWKHNYRSETVDAIKFSADFDGQVIDQKPTLFLKHWYSVFKNNKLRFVKAFLLQTAGIWREYTPHDYIVTLLSRRGLLRNGPGQNLYTLNETNKDAANAQIEGKYKAYRADSMSSNKKYISYRKFKQIILKSDKALAVPSKLPKLRVRLNRQFWNLSNKYQKYIARGGAAVLCLLVATAILMFRAKLSKFMGIMIVPWANLLSLVVAVPATDFRYIYSLLFSVILIFLYSLTVQNEKGTSHFSLMRNKP
jgi:hypothetical protein